MARRVECWSRIPRGCIEIEAQGKRIAFDVGLPLDAPDEGHERRLPDVAGLPERDDSLLGVLISHPHQDHYGLARYLLSSVKQDDAFSS